MNLQYVRAFAALWVMIFHYTIGLAPDSLIARGAYMIVSHGYLGVDIFFVLSGYIVSYTYAHRKNTILGFMAMRYARIYVGFVPIVAVYLIYLNFAPIPFSGNIVKSLLLIMQPAEHTPISVTWTLHYELNFYILFVLIALLPIKRKKFLIMSLVSIYGLWICYLMINFIDPLEHFTNILKPFHYSIKYMLLPYTLDFCAGVAIFFYKPRIPHALGMSFIAFIAFLAVEYVIFSDMKAFQQTNYFFYRVIAALPFAMLLILAAIQTQQTHGGRIHRAAERLGDASYALYLWHFPVLNIVNHRNDGTASPLQIVIFCSIVTIILSVYWAHYIEKPLLQCAKRTIQTIELNIYRAYQRCTRIKSSTTHENFHDSQRLCQRCDAVYACASEIHVRLVQFPKR